MNRYPEDGRGRGVEKIVFIHKAQTAGLTPSSSLLDNHNQAHHNL